MTARGILGKTHYTVREQHKGAFAGQLLRSPEYVLTQSICSVGSNLTMQEIHIAGEILQTMGTFKNMALKLPTHHHDSKRLMQMSGLGYLFWFSKNPFSVDYKHSTLL